MHYKLVPILKYQGNIINPKLMKKISTLIALILIMSTGYSQVNGYAKVTSVLGPVLTVSHVNETYDQFNIGDKVIIMQMQDDVIGANTGNNSSFGTLSDIGNAGKYEIATIALVARVAGLVDIITLTGSLNNSYSLNTNSSLQIITFPSFGTVNYSTAADITAVPWDGNIGGVVAMHVPGKLHLNHNITADYAGFRGGASDANNSTDASCNDATFYSPVNFINGNKGEGIYKVTNLNYAAGIGRMVNGGGGGNGHNAGGGGGSNYTGGGNGALGYNCTTITGGFGGTPLSSNIHGTRFFMGGGAGAGEANNGGNTKGGNGGGIVIIKAQEIKVNTAGARISANGQSAANVGNDGAGGGGAGGTVLLEVNSWDLSSSAPLAVSANAGSGGNVVDGSRHGAGAGGGQGVTIFSSIAPTANATISTTNGLGGLNYTGGTRAPNGLGANNAGIISSPFLILPVKLVSFTATLKTSNTELKWKTENENGVGFYEIQWSKDGSNFQGVGKQHATGNSSSSQTYSFVHNLTSSATNFYRLKMTDLDGKFTYSNIVVTRSSESANTSLSVYPNPARINSVLFIKSSEAGTASVNILNMQGAVLVKQSGVVVKGDNVMVLESIGTLPSAVYNVQVNINKKSYYTRIIVQK
jgi:hypothetical protein